jgi:uncharacterized protein YkwD
MITQMRRSPETATNWHANIYNLRNICPQIAVAPDPAPNSGFPSSVRPKPPALVATSPFAHALSRGPSKKGARPCAASRFSLLAVLALAACTPTPGTERVTAGESVDIASAGAQLSVQRAQNGLVRPLGYSPALQAAAESHAQYLSRTGNFSHDGAGGTTRSVPRRRAGYQACLVAENIARGQPDIRSVVATG